MSYQQLFIDGAQQLGIEISTEQIKMFEDYQKLVIEWNEKINLTAITEEKEFIIKHFLDSITSCEFVDDKGSLIDLGTGAGFPGIPIKIAKPSLNVTLADSLEKRVKFLNCVIDDLKLRQISAVHGRAEELSQKKEYREAFDYCVARAVASLPVLLEYCLPFVKVGGTFIAMKAQADEEVSLATKALKVLGGEISEIKQLVLPFSDNNRTLIIIKKTKNTPKGYPRKAGKPSKEPII